MLHLNRFNQYHIKIESPQKNNDQHMNKKYDHQLKTMINLIKPNDILNIYGENPLDHQKCFDLLKYMRHKGIYTRVWMNQWIKNFDQENLNYLLNELVIWCPEIIKEEFNLVSGRDFFDDYSRIITALKLNKTLSFTVRPMSIEDLPEFYDLIVDTQSNGLLLYIKSEFSSEELKYIKRFKKVNHIQIMEINNLEAYVCQSIPNTIGTLKFEFQDWCYNIRQSIKKVPILKYTI